MPIPTYYLFTVYSNTLSATVIYRQNRNRSVIHRRTSHHRNPLTGFTRARATIKLTSQLTDRLAEVKGDPPPKLWLKLFSLDEGITKETGHRRYGIT
ncbi:MAG: hypothetical protein ABFS18_04620 [Thermodesulfobacteriota bacterium]